MELEHFYHLIILKVVSFYTNKIINYKNLDTFFKLRGFFFNRKIFLKQVI